MDTGSHILFGVTLGVLATQNSVIASHDGLSVALMAATIIGSNAPDFDSIVRLSSKDNYLKHHRGITHSLPALCVWPFLISLPLADVLDVWSHFSSLLFFSCIAVIFHVLLDWFNAYGVQCFRPLTKKWQHLDVLPIFDPFLFTLHCTGLLIWQLGWFSGSSVFMVIYCITFGYLAIRLWAHKKVIRRMKENLRIPGDYMAIPTLHWFKWQFIVETEETYYTGNVTYNHMEIKDMYRKPTYDEFIEASKGVDGVRSFILFASKIHVKLMKVQEGYEVQWRDVRFWHNHKLPYGINVTLDEQMNVTKTEIGWTKKSWDPPYV